MILSAPLRVYHGSSDTRWVDLVRSGDAELEPDRRRTGDRWMWPLPGRVYVTPSIGQALKYANWKEGRQVSDPEPWDGVVLDVVVPAGADVLPDEDCVGEAVGYAFGMDERSICGWDVADLFWSADSDKLFAELARVARPHLPFAPEVFESSPSLRMLVRAGKSVLPHLPDHLQRALIAHGANISVVPPVDVLGAWVVGGPAETTFLRACRKGSGNAAASAVDGNWRVGGGETSG